MYSDDDSDTSSEESSVISSIDSDSSDDSESSEKEAADDEVVAVRKIKIELFEILSNPGVMARRLNLADDPEIIESYIGGAVNTIKNFDRLENYNTGLVAIAACYDMLYKGVVNDKNVTDFIGLKIGNHTYDPIDVIRYITLYSSKK